MTAAVCIIWVISFCSCCAVFALGPVLLLVNCRWGFVNVTVSRLLAGFSLKLGGKDNTAETACLVGRLKPHIGSLFGD